MANISAYAQKASLDWVLGGASVTRPATHYMGLSLGAPNSTNGSEMSAGSYARVAISFAAAASPAGVATNAAAVTFGANGTTYTASGWQIWDTNLSHNSGNMLWYGTMPAFSSINAASALVFGAGSVRCSLA